MDQKKLHQVEKQCIQEEAPACQSACPLHVDVRTFVLQISQGKWNDAWKTLGRSMPFPGILGRICDHPCEKSCLRSKLGGAISIGELEKSCVNQPKPRIRVIPMPKKNKSMAIVGEELSSLVAALELLKKGYAVTLFTHRDRLGGTLWEISDDILPKEILKEELAILESLGLKVEKTVQPDKDALAFFKKEFSATYIGLENPEYRFLAQGKEPEPKTFALGMDGFFAGPIIDNNETISPLHQAFHGKSAALSMERFAQKVSLIEGRNDDGPYPTRLFTNIKGIDLLPIVSAANGEKGYSSDEAKAEALRCINCQCLECLKVCPYLAEYKGYPKRYAREIYNNASIVLGNHSANLMVNSCSLCGLCQEICPENFSMADLCLDARKDLVQRNKMPPSAHEFALLDMEFSSSDLFMLGRHAPEKEKSRFAFFPGCQLSGAYPDHVIKTYLFLLNNFADDTALMMQCCSAPAHWSGNESKTADAISLLQGNWQRMGQPQMILACSSCVEMFKKYLPEIKTISLWEVMDQCDLPLNAVKSVKNTMAIHDPCTTRHAPGIHKAVRSLAAKLGIATKELKFSREKTECCGFGGLMENANPAMAKKQLEMRTSESDLDFITYCAMCRESLRGAGKRTVHLLDFLFPMENFPSDPADRPRIGLSHSRENRAKLKNDLLTLIWKEKPTIKREVLLHISPKVQTKLEERRILAQDIRDAIAFAERSGKAMENIVTGHFLACHRPLMVTFWVEYSKTEQGYNIHNSYCHRMQVMGEKA